MPDGDHDIRFTDGGKTDLFNGRLLCKPCHQLKTRKENMSKKSTKTPRGFQKRIIEQAKVDYASKRKNKEGLLKKWFIVCACPGSGKTLLGLFFREIFLGRVFSVIFVPTDNIRTQTINTYNEEGLRLATIEDIECLGALPNKFNGVVLTYGSQAKRFYKDILPDWRANSPNFLLFLLLDELHHAQDNGDASWGLSVSLAISESDYYLGLSGTPMRHDGNPVAGFEYDDDGQLVFDAQYPYIDAMSEFNCRMVEFKTFGSKVDFKYLTSVQEDDGKVVEVEYANTLDITTIDISTSQGERDHTAALRTMFAQKNLEACFELAFKDAENTRKVYEEGDRGKIDRNGKPLPIPKGLVFAPPGVEKLGAQDGAKYLDSIADSMEKILGYKPIVIYGDDPDCANKLKELKTTGVWGLSMKMIAEGTDIPALRVGVMACSYASEPFLIQLWFRFLRNMTSRDNGGELQVATIFMPAFPHLKEFANKLTKQCDLYLKKKKEGGGGGGGGSGNSQFFAGNATHEDHEFVSGGTSEKCDDPFVVKASKMKNNPIFANITTVQLTEALRDAETTTPEQKNESKNQDLDEQRLRNDLNNVARRATYARCKTSKPDPADFIETWKTVYYNFVGKFQQIQLNGTLKSLFANYSLREILEVKQFLEELCVKYQSPT